MMFIKINFVNRLELVRDSLSILLPPLKCNNSCMGRPKVWSTSIAPGSHTGTSKWLVPLHFATGPLLMFNRRTSSFPTMAVLTPSLQILDLLPWPREYGMTNGLEGGGLLLVWVGDLPGMQPGSWLSAIFMHIFSRSLQVRSHSSVFQTRQLGTMYINGGAQPNQRTPRPSGFLIHCGDSPSAAGMMRWNCDRWLGKL